MVKLSTPSGGQVLDAWGFGAALNLKRRNSISRHNVLLCAVLAEPRTAARALSGMTSPALDQILFFEDLRIISQRRRLAEVERWAIDQQIPFKYDGRGGIWTTLDAVNASLGVVIGSRAAQQPYPLDIDV